MPASPSPFTSDGSGHPHAPSPWVQTPPADETESRSSGSLIIDCDECVLQASEACGDCIVTFLCGVDSESPVVVDLAEVRAMRTLGDAGLAPPLRHRRSVMRA